MKIVIGRSDVVDFPNLNLEGIDIKIDTGAYTSSIHCHSIYEEDDILKCKFLDPKHKKYHKKELSFQYYSKKKVKSSNGISETRYAIKTNILIFNKIRTIELTLTERGAMKFPVLIGRKFLSKRFIVDSSKKNLSLYNILKKL